MQIIDFSRLVDKNDKKILYLHNNVVINSGIVANKYYISKADRDLRAVSFE
jgi:hypothetical protein